MESLTRRSLLKATGAAALVSNFAPLISDCSGSDKSGADVVRPNVVLVMTDDQGYGDLGCHGNEVIETPNLDRLHAESLRLTDFHVDPTCSPTRSALMTGRYSSRTGVWHTIMGRSILRRDEVTMADVFRASGYRTGIFGKWHLGDNYPCRPQDRGFDEVLIHGGGGVGQGPDYWGNDYFDDTYLHNGKATKYDGYCTDVFFDGAMRFIESSRERRFFCYLPTNAPHGPYNVADKYSRPYREKGVPKNQADFYGMITNIDENMGRLVSHLERLGLRENTILIFMTDNGTSAGSDAGMRGSKGSEYDGGHRVPFFMRWPGAGFSGGRDVERLTAHVDVLPTLIDLCRLVRPPNVDFDGRTISPLLLANAGTWPERTLFVHSQRIENPEKWRKSAVMTDRWRLVNGSQLYDIKADPAQQKDVSKQQPAVVERLRDSYEQWWSDISVRFAEYCEIVIGSEHENPTCLMSHDWHGANPAWSQQAVRAGSASNGFWAVELEKDGAYEFELRRWPAEVDAPINAPITGGKAVRADRARLRIGDIEMEAPIPDGAKKVTFRLRLTAGKSKLQTWLIGDNGESRGAYYVYARLL